MDTCRESSGPLDPERHAGHCSGSAMGNVRRPVMKRLWTVMLDCIGVCKWLWIGNAC